MKDSNIIVNDFVKRQTASSRFSHFNGTWHELVVLVQQNWNYLSPGYRDGVILARVPPEGFFSSVVDLLKGDELTGGFEPRREGEDPRKFVTVNSRNKVAARTVDIVLYASTVLAEDGDNSLPPEPGNWEIISINAFPTLGDMPISPMVLMHNHFNSTGGTATNLSDTEFVNMLRESFNYWKNKANCG